MKFSLVVPALNASRHIGRCLESLAAQTIEPGEFEVLVANDASTDDTVEVVNRYCGRLLHLTVLHAAQNGGPGAGRNLGLDAARGEWVLFLDSDDRLLPDALASLAGFIDAQGPSVELVGFDWRYHAVRDDLMSSRRSGRRDAAYFAERPTLLERYAQMRMDMSVIFNAYRRDLLVRENLRFEDGVHEDVDFAFAGYASARSIGYLDQVLYDKHNTPTSIVNGISHRHLNGFMRAWRAVGDRIAAATELAPLSDAYAWGTVGAVATRVREIVRHAPDPARAGELFDHLNRLVCDLFTDFQVNRSLRNGHTVYHQIARHFLETMQSEITNPEGNAAEIVGFAMNLEGKSWSCQDLHHSAFLAPDEVRTCCKRFFVDGEMRGDVVLFRTEEDHDKAVSTDQILRAKRALHQAINSGEPTACDGCPFLEFKAWPALNRLDVQYLSMEHHSICNLKCTYCSETYYGGARATYDIEKTVEGMLDEGAMQDCTIVVWGGGDPVVVKEFAPLLTKIADMAPRAQQRVLTNSVKHSPVLHDLMLQGRAYVITSLDAGTEATFRLVRGRPGFKRACDNIKKYAETGKVTIKYIFTDGNSSTEESQAFVQVMKDWSLLDCSFQISSDFKQEVIPYESAINMSLMFGLLREAGSESVIFDELLRIRLTEVLETQGAGFIDEVHRLAGFEFIASPERYPSVIVWGAGQQAKCLADDTLFFRKSEIRYFVDSTPSKIGTTYLGREVRDPSVLSETNDPILIAAVQAYPFIISEFKRMKLDPSRLLTDLVI